MTLISLIIINMYILWPCSAVSGLRRSDSPSNSTHVALSDENGHIERLLAITSKQS